MTLSPSKAGPQQKGRSESAINSQPLQQHLTAQNEGVKTGLSSAERRFNEQIEENIQYDSVNKVESADNAYAKSSEATTVVNTVTETSA